MARQSHIGGDVAHRGFFGGTMPRARTVGLIVIGVGAAVAMILLKTLGMVLAVSAAALWWLLTMRSPQGSPLDRLTDRRRWRDRERLGLVRFVPYSDSAWDELMAARPKRRKERPAWLRQVTAMRQNPDGAEGMHWLQQEARQPGIAWHTPVGEAGYLSVAWATAGQIAGLEGTEVTDRRAEDFGKLLAGWASELKLPGSVQVMTRVLPTDTARHELWVASHLDDSAPPELVASYDELMQLIGRGGLVQRHLIVVRWPVGKRFLSEAAKLGQGLDGWRGLMASQIASVTRVMEGAGFQRVQPLSARQVAAMLRHLQCPDYPADQVRDISDASDCWFPSVDQWSYVTVTAPHPETGEETQWCHRTALISAGELSDEPRSSLWLASLLTGMEERIVRTVSFQIAVRPAAAAKAQAARDATIDTADIKRQKDKNKLVVDESEDLLSASQRRMRDLRAGSHHQGAEWVGHLTISERSRDALAEAIKHITEAAEGAGIRRLQWLDTYQAAAAACTWPIARGLRPPHQATSERVAGAVSGRGPKEAL